MNGGQNTQVQQLLSQLADIKGLDNISWWPLAPGWWVLIAFAALILLAGILFYLRRIIYLKSWKHDADRTLMFMAEQLNEINARPVLIKLSTLLRRIAIRRFSRAECAGLKGRQWVDWLMKNDPGKFDWRKHEGLLTEGPYSPPDSALPLAEIKLLINAARKWVK